VPVSLSIKNVPEPVRSLEAVLAEIRASGLATPSDSVDILRRDRRRGDD